MSNRSKGILSALIILGALFTFGSTLTYAAVPDSINYQGILKTGGGTPVADGSYSVVFSIYDVASGPDPALWTETKSVTTAGGLFTTLLGSVTPLPPSVFSGPNRYLGITVAADPEMTPRTAIVAVPYAYRIATVDGATGGSISSEVGINTAATAGVALTTNGPIKIADGTQGLNKVLTSDPSGLGSWQTPPGTGTPGGSNGSVQFNNGGAFGGDATNFFWDNANKRLGIGTTTPNEQLEITGNLRLPTSTASAGVIKSGANPFIHNFGTNNTFIGVNAGNFTMIGLGGNTASGQRALVNNSTGSQNTADGQSALEANTTGTQNTASGSLALFSNTTGSHNTACGVNALLSNTTGNQNTACGDFALVSNTTGDRNTAIGPAANVSTGNLTNATAIGAGAVVSASNCLVLGNAVNVGIGTSSPSSRFAVGSSSQFQVNATGNLTRINNVAYSFPAAQGAASTVLQNDGAGTLSWSAGGGGGAFLPLAGGTMTGPITSTGSPSITMGPGNFIGGLTVTAGNVNLGASSATAGNILKGGVTFIHAFGTANTFIGQQAGNLTMTGNSNTASGAFALIDNTTGNNNTASGAFALSFNTTGDSNTASGRGALFGNTTGSNNTASGAFALFFNTTGDSNTASGRGALSSNTTGSGNTAVGFGANVSAGTLHNATAIGAGAVVSASDCLVLGNAVNVGIGTSSPTKKLEVAGSIKVGASDTVFCSNLSSNSPLSLQAPAGTQRMYIDDATGHVGIGTNVPEGSMHVFAGTAGSVTANGNSTLVLESDTENWLHILSPDATQRGILFGSPANPLIGSIRFNPPGTEKGYNFRCGNNNTRLILDSLGNLTADGCVVGTNLTCPSDARFKRDIATIPNALDMVGRLRGVNYEWQREQFADRNFPAGQQIGLIAQEVQKVVPQAVVPMPDGYLSVDYSRLVPVLIEGMKEQQKQIDAQNSLIGELEARLDRLEKRP